LYNVHVPRGSVKLLLIIPTLLLELIFYIWNLSEVFGAKYELTVKQLKKIKTAHCNCKIVPMFTSRFEFR